MALSLQAFAQPLKSIKVPSAVDRYKQLAEIQGMQQDRELRGLQIENARAQQMSQATTKQQSEEEWQKVQAIFAKHTGDPEAAIPEILNTPWRDPEIVRTYQTVLTQRQNAARQTKTDAIADVNFLDGRPGEEFARPQLSATPEDLVTSAAPIPGQEGPNVLPHPSINVPGMGQVTSRTEQDKNNLQRQFEKFKTDENIRQERARQQAEKEFNTTNPANTPQPTADIQNYKFDVSQGYTGTFKQWQDEDANRKRPVVQPSGLTSQAQTRVQTLASQFDSNPVVKNYNEAALRFAGINDLVKGKWTGPSDMAVVFEFMRSLDPTSVVRESEYATAAKSGNIFSGWAAKFNGALNPSGGFLSPQVKKDFAETLGVKMKQAKSQVQNMHKDFGRRIDLITGQPGTGTGFLTDPSAMVGDAPSAAGGGGKAPSGVDQAVWDVMTPQERALWQN